MYAICVRVLRKRNSVTWRVWVLENRTLEEQRSSLIHSKALKVNEVYFP